MMKREPRRSSGREEPRRDDDRRRDRDDRRSGSSSHHQSQSRSGNVSGSGNQDRSQGQYSEHRSGGHNQNRSLNSFNGMAFTESQLLDDLPKKKFTGRCRLFVGNLPNEVQENELKEMFSAHGEIAECYLSGKGFAFLRLDTRAHAESAKEAIDGRVIHGRQIRVRFAVHGAALRVKELSPTVSNEMLYHAFSHFGDVERAVHIVDDKGRPTGEGIVEFERKPHCNEAMTVIREKVFLLTASPKPLVVEVMEPRDEDDGLAERLIPRTPALSKERELGPRFPPPNSFEYAYGLKWKELYAIEKQRRAQLEEELREARRRLETDMELAYQDYQAQMLREDLQRRQQELERLEAARRERMRGMMGPPGANSMSVPPPHSGYPPQAFMGGPPPFAAPQQGFGQPPGMFNPGGPPGGPMMGPGGPPPGGPGGPPHPGPPRTNMIEGVQRLLQIFKNDNGAAANLLNRQNEQPKQFSGSPYSSEYPPPEKKRR
ncbi:unnamed protein product [Caenorhabditis bovis]|uniref:RRM domain-containing protein n=1 Tax=Caenorhabditis bovis TaxID=2654633 RepID=A0A8S1ER76_9PELO|nr:unnamed protein product [Caenorhabditis bovis]